MLVMPLKASSGHSLSCSLAVVACSEQLQMAASAMWWLAPLSFVVVILLCPFALIIPSTKATFQHLVQPCFSSGCRQCASSCRAEPRIPTSMQFSSAEEHITDTPI